MFSLLNSLKKINIVIAFAGQKAEIHRVIQMLKDREEDMKLVLFELFQVYMMGLFLTLPLRDVNPINIHPIIC